MHTSIEEFDRWLGIIPYGFHPYLIPVREGKKSPFVPKRCSWKEKEFQLDENAARERLEEDGNVGFVARDDLAVVDVDDEQKTREVLGEDFFETLTVSTRSGGKHLYFWNGGVRNSDIPDVLEIRANWRYVLVPGSYVDPGDTKGNGLYEVIDDVTPAMLFPNELPERLRKRGGEELGFVPVLRTPGEPFENRHGWKLETVRKRDEKLDALLSHLRYEDLSKEIQRKFDKDKDTSTSGLDMSTAIKLIYWEFEPSTCVDILREFRPRDKMLDRPSYAETTVKNAQSRTKKTISDRVNPDTWNPRDIYNKITIGGGNENG